MGFRSLTTNPPTTIVWNPMRATKNNTMADSQLKFLEQKIDELIALCNDLNRENQSLKADSANWRRERQALIERNELARGKVEAMLGRLRTLEHPT